MSGADPQYAMSGMLPVLNRPQLLIVDLDMDPAVRKVHPLWTVTDGMLLISGLDDSINDVRLWQMLCPLGELIFSRVLGSGPGEPQGFAYAKYTTLEEAEKAMEQFPTLTEQNNGKPLFCIVSELGASTRFCDAGKLNVSGLCPTITNQEVLKIFSACGEVSSVQMYVDLRNGGTKDAIVHFTNEISSQRAIKNLNGTLINDREITIQHYDRLKPRSAAPAQCVIMRPFNVDPTWDTKKIEESLSFLGRVVVRIERYADGTSKGTAVANFEKPGLDTPIFSVFSPYSMSQTVFLSLSPTHPLKDNIGAKTLREARYMKYPSTAEPLYDSYLYPAITEEYDLEWGTDQYCPGPGAKPEDYFIGAYHVHVTGIPDSYSSANLCSKFQQYGAVFFCRIFAATDDDNKFGLVSYSVWTDALKAVEETRKAKRKGYTMVAEIIDSYQMYHFAQMNDSIRNGLSITNSGMPLIHSNMMLVNDKTGTTKRIPSREVASIVQNRLYLQYHENLDEFNTEVITDLVPNYFALDAYAQIAVTLQKTNDVAKILGVQQGTLQRQMQMNYTTTPPFYIPSLVYQQMHALFSQYAYLRSQFYAHTYAPQVAAALLPGFAAQAAVLAPSATAAAVAAATSQAMSAKVDQGQEQHRPQIMEKIAELFPKSKPGEREDMLKTALQMPLDDLLKILSNDHAFRVFFIKKAVAAARQRKAVQEAAEAAAQA
ncbi:unnamed protein product [Caenorhabditis sp. 36 PRJEB53466]|nr:unnamed protein product [Caenorhabditis sp. 36 PRJEB53466]